MARGRKVSRYFMEQWTTNREFINKEYLEIRGKKGRTDFCRKYHIDEATFYKCFGASPYRFSSKKPHIQDINNSLLKFGDIRKGREIVADYGISELKRISHTYDMTKINE